MPRTPDSFEQLEATLLFCPKCREAKPVRKRLLIILPEGDKFDYVCTLCGSVAGDKIEKAPPSPTLDGAVLPPLRTR